MQIKKSYFGILIFILASLKAYSAGAAAPLCKAELEKINLNYRVSQGYENPELSDILSIDNSYNDSQFYVRQKEYFKDPLLWYLYFKNSGNQSDDFGAYTRCIKNELANKILKSGLKLP